MSDKHWSRWTEDDCRQAADEIARLRAALKPFADAAEPWLSWASEFNVGDYKLNLHTAKVKVSDLIEARAALDPSATVTESGADPTKVLS